QEGEMADGGGAGLMSSDRPINRAKNGRTARANASDFRHPLRNAIATNTPSATGTPKVLRRIEIPDDKPERMVTSKPLCFSIAFAAKTHATSVNAANARSDIKSAERIRMSGCNEKYQVSINADISFRTWSLSRIWMTYM